MKTDRELLELAAKAAGLDFEWCDVWGGMARKLGIIDGFDWETYWNPLLVDGDALRLAAALKLHILHNDPGESVLWVSAVLNKTMLHGAEEFQAEDGRSDATRRAIVRAAAAIGESML